MRRSRRRLRSRLPGRLPNRFLGRDLGRHQGHFRGQLRGHSRGRLRRAMSAVGPACRASSAPRGRSVLTAQAVAAAKDLTAVPEMRRPNLISPSLDRIGSIGISRDLPDLDRPAFDRPRTDQLVRGRQGQGQPGSGRVDLDLVDLRKVDLDRPGRLSSAMTARPRLARSVLRGSLRRGHRA